MIQNTLDTYGYDYTSLAHGCSIGRSLYIGDFYIDKREDNTYPTFCVTRGNVISDSNSVINPSNTWTGDNVLIYTPVEIKVSTQPILNFTQKLWMAYTKGTGLYTFKKGTTFYHVGKGIITDNHYNPFVMVVIKVPTINEKQGIKNYELKFDKRDVTVWLSRIIFTPEFKTNHSALHKLLFNVIIPHAISNGIRVGVKESLSMFTETKVYPELSFDEMQSKYKGQLMEVINGNFRSLF